MSKTAAVVPNTAEALDQLPDGTVIRGVGHGGYAISSPSAGPRRSAG